MRRFDKIRALLTLDQVAENIEMRYCKHLMCRCCPVSDKCDAINRRLQRELQLEDVPDKEVILAWLREDIT